VNLTDTHCHLDLDKFDSDREPVLERASQAGVVRILIPGLSLLSSQSVVRLVQTHPMLYAAIGVHPTEAATWATGTVGQLKELASGSSGFKKVVAIGEIGLDYYWDSAPHDIQKTILRAQLDLAADLDLPVILHMREAKDAPTEVCAQDLLQILREWCSGLQTNRNPLAARPGVLHSFSGSLETAQAAMQLGFYIGVTGPATFENARTRQAIVAQLPLDHLLIETDAPFLAPHPNRGKRNEPAYVRLIADKIALLHSRTVEEVAILTSQNAGKLFAWKETA
jgi:TatD DNase family protein